MTDRIGNEIGSEEVMKKILNFNYVNHLNGNHDQYYMLQTDHE